MKRSMTWILLGILLTAGIALISYPYVLYTLSASEQAAVIYHYDTTAETLPDEEKAAMLLAARQYNARLADLTGNAPFDPTAVLPQDYEAVLNLGNGIMGSLEIPAIHVNLPIYHGTDSETLAKGAGHLRESSLPVGGEGTHAVLSSHTGFSKARLFTDLDKLGEGDRFYIHVLDQTLVYEVDQIKVVDPEDTSALKPVSGKDYVTLLTCTPYGINSHRLLVRGVRVMPDATGNEAYPQTTQQNNPLPLALSAAGLMVLSLGIWQIRKRSICHTKRGEKNG